MSSYFVSLKICVWDAELRELRAECFIKENEPRKAISDLKAASKLKNDNTEAFYKISTLYYQLGDHELSLRLVLEVRESLFLLNPNSIKQYLLFSVYVFGIPQFAFSSLFS